MIKNVTRLEHKIGDKIYHFTCDVDAGILDCKAALLQFLGYCSQVEETARAKIEADAKAASQEESKVVPLEQTN